MRIPVFLSAWEIDCCLPVPSVGDAVEWRLAWYDDPEHPAAFEIRWAAEATLRLGGYESDHIGVESGLVITRGPVAAWRREPGAVPFRGALLALAHGFVPAAVPPTRGRAGEVSLVIGTQRKTRDGHWEDVPDGWSTWPVTDGGSWTDWEDYAALAGPLPHNHHRQPSGVVVHVDVAP
ncbi:hypothetical protein DQ237_06995 [Blastococcus sp. TF02-8]|uniref:DUF6578 domain-containing protein n=1 Tax=Blastococcus sp. TF02-8 TaxID=2250574 RepID=UPI000DE94C0C|nr:DUF6578 domain-containing protein [Blastococcus sp. TF02-8]RBY97297.1 hypothetical protein DQ237_06995 [Blastococcus sp. TF02-8]